jgi:tetratricopeptide (TPR) repeat protein
MMNSRRNHVFANRVRDEGMASTLKRSGKRRWPLVGAVVLGLGCLGWGWFRTRPSGPGDAAIAYGRGDWLAAATLAQERLQNAKDDPEALRILARASARSNRCPSAQAAYARLRADVLEAEDHYLQGLCSKSAGRFQAAVASWKKALAADPDHAETLNEMARIAMHQAHPIEAAQIAERLARRPDWEVRGNLLLGMIRAADHDPAGAALMLEKALGRDPTARIALSERFGTHKLLARTLMQAGRPADAARALRPVLEAGADREASWLVSRAFLQEGHSRAAAAHLTESGDYRADHPLEAEPAPYVGEARCAECHRQVFHTMLASRHARTFTRGDDLARLPLPEGPMTDADDPRVSHSFRRAGGEIQLETRVEDKALRAVVDYALGSSDRYLSMVGHDEEGRSRVLRLSYYQGSDGKGWQRTKDQPPHPETPEQFLGKAFDTLDGGNECLKCHTTVARSVRNRSGPESADHAIGCEGCHGPGGLHLASVSAHFSDLAIANPARATAALVNHLCGRCHSQHLTEMPSALGDRAWARFPGSTLPSSRCYTESGGSLGCVTCHDPHRDAETSVTFYESKCLSCHATSNRARDGARTGEGASRSPCPVSASRGCLPCHMPKVWYPEIHTHFTDHYIRVQNRSNDRG